MTQFSEFAEVAAKIHDPKLMEKFLKCILTPTEQKEISSRWTLVQLLDLGVSQRQIAKKLHISLCKITRGSRELKKRDSAFRFVLDKYNK